MIDDDNYYWISDARAAISKQAIERDNQHAWRFIKMVIGCCIVSTIFWVAILFLFGGL